MYRNWCKTIFILYLHHSFPVYIILYIIIMRACTLSTITTNYEYDKIQTISMYRVMKKKQYYFNQLCFILEKDMNNQKRI